MSAETSNCKVTLLTGGGDKPYAIGITEALLAENIAIDFVGSDDLECPALRNRSGLAFLNLRGSQDPQAPSGVKLRRIIKYYLRLLRYAWTARPRIFHILWNDRFQVFDRTALMLCYKLLRKRVVFTAHNVNAAARDNRDSFINRLSLRIQYRLADHIFVHTEKMKGELQEQFSVPANKVSVIPFGINNTLPNTALTGEQARASLGLKASDKVILFFGRIAPYKGLDALVEVMGELARRDASYKLVIAGSVKDCPEHWRDIQERMMALGLEQRVLERIEFIPDERVEVFFKAADLVVLPYTGIFQSGVLFLGYSFGLPVVATDVGSFREDILEGQTGFVCRPSDQGDLAAKIEEYFGSELFRNLPQRREFIRAFANERYSWSKVGRITRSVYSELLGNGRSVGCSEPRPVSERG